MMYEVAFKNALFNKPVIAGIRPEFLNGGVWAMLGLWDQGNWKGALRHKWVGGSDSYSSQLLSISIYNNW